MTLTERESELLDFLTDAAEPTWIMLDELPELGWDREALEVVLGGLEQRGLVQRTREPSCDPVAVGMTFDDWWALTRSGWQALGRQMPVGYEKR